MIINKKYLLISSILILFILVVIVVISMSPKSKIMFSIAPETATMSIDDKTYSVKSGDSINFKPGEYVYKLSRDGFEEYTSKITVKSGNETELLAALKPTTEEARKLLLDVKSQIIVQRFYGINYSESISDISKEYPLIDILPIRARLYTISSCRSEKYPDDNSKIAICADITLDELKPYVIKDIESRGFNIKDYELIWIHTSSIGE